jgi:hypothetical protein
MRLSHLIVILASVGAMWLAHKAPIRKPYKRCAVIYENKTIEYRCRNLDI